MLSVEGDSGMILPYLLISILALLSIHLLALAGITGYCNRKKYESLTKTISFWDRWFFISVQALVKDQYSKREKKIIRYTIIARIYQKVNIFIHIIFLMEIAAIIFKILFRFSIEVEHIFLLYMFVYFICLFIFYFGNNYTSKEFHRVRMRRRR